MCEPVMTALSIASTAMGAYGAYKETKAQNEANEYNAKVAEQNARIAEMQAADAEERGELEEKRHRLQVSKLKGQQRSTLSASGVSVESGSAFDTLGDTEYFGEMDALEIRNNASREAWSYRNQANQYMSDADMYRSSNSSPWLSAGTSLLGGATKLSKRFSQNRKTYGNIWGSKS